MIGKAEIQKYSEAFLLECTKENPNVEILESLIVSGADVGIKNEYGSNALYSACHNRKPNLTLIEFLIEQFCIKEIPLNTRHGSFEWTCLACCLFRQWG